MNKLIITLLLLPMLLAAQGEQPAPLQTFTLEQAVTYAHQHASAVQNAAIDAEISSQKVKEIVGMGLPQLKAEFDLKNFIKIPVSLVPGEFFGAPAGSFIPVQFGTKYQATAGVSASQLLFEPSYLIGVQATKTYKELSQKNLQRTKTETTVAVTKAYYNVLVNRERMKLLEANVRRVEKLKNDVSAYYQNGIVEKLDADRIKLAYNNLTTEKENVQRLLVLGEALLKYQMGMDIAIPISLTDSLSIAGNLSAPTGALNVSNRIEFSILETQKRLLYLDMKRNKSSYLPSLFAYGTLNANAFANEFDIFEKKKGWYPIALIGGSLQWNLFDGLSREAKIRQSKLTLRKVENEIVNATNGLALEAESNRVMLNNALASLNTQKENLDLANEVVRITRIKYDQGIGSNLEIIEAETALRESQTNYFNAVYEALVAKTELEKAIGNIK